MIDRRLSMIAFAADAAEDAPRALITAEPRLATVGMNTSSNQPASEMTLVAASPLILAFL